MKTKHNVTKLPRWAQELIAGLQQDLVDDRNHIRGLIAEFSAMEETLATKKSVERIADFDRRILSQVNKALGEAITTELTGYQKPLSKIVERVIADHSTEIYNLVNDEFVTLLTAGDFRVELKTALNAKLARVLIQRMGGELESKVNELKSNPQTNALITLAITDVVAKLLQGEVE